jgi:hypothetical protein
MKGLRELNLEYSHIYIYLRVFKVVLSDIPNQKLLTITE